MADQMEYMQEFRKEEGQRWESFENQTLRPGVKPPAATGHGD